MRRIGNVLGLESIKRDFCRNFVVEYGRDVCCSKLQTGTVGLWRGRKFRRDGWKKLQEEFRIVGMVACVMLGALELITLLDKLRQLVHAYMTVSEW